jgi:hypothetical protein
MPCGGRSWAGGFAGAAALVFAVACGGARPAASPKAEVRPATKPLAPEQECAPERTEPPESVELVARGAEPRQSIRYALGGGTPTLLRSELVLFQPVYRFETTYGPVQRGARGYDLSVNVKLETSNSMLGMFGAALFAAAPACAASISVDARGLFDSSRLFDKTCSRIDATLLGLRQTPLHPTLPLPNEPIGVGARWRVSKRPGEPPGTYTLLDAEGGVLTVFGELEPAAGAAASFGSAETRAPDHAWLLARFTAGELMRSATVAWVPVSKKATTTPEPAASVQRTALMRFNSLAEGVQGARDDTRAALERALASSDAALREAALLASGLTNDWRMIPRLIELGNSQPALAKSVAHSLELLTGRTARGPEDWVEATAPYACVGDLAHSEKLLTQGIAAGGAPELVGKLLAWRASVWRELGNMAAAAQDYRDALAQSPADADVALAVAWWLATAPDAKRRDGRKAIALLDAARGNDGVLMLFSQARAAALAERRDFKEALPLQESASSRVGPANPLARAGAEKRQQAAKARLDAYTKRTPWREPLIAEEALPCYRFLGLSNTLL